MRGVEITFLGATGTVTGSKYLVDTSSARVLVDCGLFQGYKQLRLRNRAPLPVDPREIDAVVLTHAHIDHSGYLPLLVRNGFQGRVFSTEGTRDLCGVLLPDAAKIQEEEARFANLHGYSKHSPSLPLYTQQDAAAAVKRFSAVAFDEVMHLGRDIEFSFYPAGHILGAAIVSMRIGGLRVVFSGDLGRPTDVLLPPPAVVTHADYLVVESTYGDRIHDPDDPAENLAAVIRRTVERGGVVLIPAFAVGRTQSLLYYLHSLKSSGRIPDIPVYLDSPMAINVTNIFERHKAEHTLSPETCREVFNVAQYITTVEQSKALTRKPGPKIVISASGMATGGRVLHHIKAIAPDSRNTILFTGYQAGGTRGADIVAGAESVKIHGEYVDIRAEVASLNNLSAHSDWSETLRWLSNFASEPKMTFITHGEPKGSDHLRRKITERLGWACHVPDYLERYSLAALKR